ncbi:MAG: hypothetical protein BMS9Abin05_1594 [Rhodothermia bacterium]|nr:MAG: hypothetical protein BMS9Abin05_1594 [Rhodothermia bacterium]
MHSLLLIPDISGFTRFVNEIEIEHGRHIVSELLEVIIDSDDLGLTVAEIEGDAILFYLKDDVPPVPRIAALAERMFIGFHTQLKLYESRRICHCGACSSAQSLSLKIVAHAGPLEFIHVKNFLKPYGRDTILVHRLLKNSIPMNEYLLVTKHLAEKDSTNAESVLPSWVAFQEGLDSYDEIGEVRYRFAAMGELREMVPIPDQISDFERMPNPIAAEVFVNRPVSESYELISNLDVRQDWTKGLDELKFDPDRVNRVGMQHQCVVRGDLLDFETISTDYGPNKLVYGERLVNPPFVKDLALFTLLEAEGTGTRIRREFHYRRKPFPASLLTPIFRIMAKRQISSTLNNFREYVDRISLSTNNDVG